MSDATQIQDRRLIGPKPQADIEMNQRLSPALLPKQQHATLAVRLEITRLEPEGALIALQRVVIAIQSLDIAKTPRNIGSSAPKTRLQASSSDPSAENSNTI